MVLVGTFVSGQTAKDGSAFGGITVVGCCRVEMRQVGARDEARSKLRDKLNQLAQDQTEVFKPKK